ncbi:MAG TPA: ABC transporter permease [Spirochaetales bacterium]|nr:ABC transporter permease [Spirochaetales bacterium]
MKKQQVDKRSSLALRTWSKLVKNRLAMLGMIVAIVMVLVSVFANLFAPYDPSKIDFKSATRAPSWSHLMGTDKMGRDVFSEILYGGRISIYVSVVGSVLGSLVGMILGCIAGWFGGKVDAFLVRLSEIFLTFPNMILVLILVAFVGQGVNNLIFIFFITGWMTPFRMIRNEFLSLREETYVEACKAFGISNFSIMFKQILPNTISPIVVATTINIANYILQEAGLSFLGLGVPVTVPTWGNIMNAAKSVEVIRNYWWLWFFPGTVISIFVLAVNFAGDGLRDVLDPNL